MQNYFQCSLQQNFYSLSSLFPIEIIDIDFGLFVLESYSNFNIVEVMVRPVYLNSYISWILI